MWNPCCRIAVIYIFFFFIDNCGGLPDKSILRRTLDNTQLSEHRKHSRTATRGLTKNRKKTMNIDNK